MIIDGHMHLAQWMNNEGKNVFDVLRDFQKENGIDAVDNMCCSSNGTLWKIFEVDQNILGAIAKIENPSVFTHGCLRIPDHLPASSKIGVKDQFEELMEIGLDGVKICDFKPDAYKNFNVEEHLEEYDEYIGLCEKYNVHMCWHVADPVTFWDPEKVSESAKMSGWFYGDGTYATYEHLMKVAYDFIDSHPKLNLMLAHMFFKSKTPDELVALLEKYPNVNIDFGPGWGMFADFKNDYDKWYDIFRKYSDRFVYATDATMCVTAESMAKGYAQYVLKFLQTDEEFEVYGKNVTRGIKLEKEYLDKILYKNHQRIVGEKPHEINKKALKKHIERCLPIMPDSKNKQMTQEYYRRELL